MDSFELNKIIGAVLATCLVVLVTSFTANALFAPVMPDKPGYLIAAKQEGSGAAKEAAPPPSEPIEKLLQTASVEKGQPRRRNAPPATPSIRAARTGSARTFTASLATPEAKDAGDLISPLP